MNILTFSMAIFLLLSQHLVMASEQQMTTNTKAIRVTITADATMAMTVTFSPEGAAVVVDAICVVVFDIIVSYLG